MECENNPFSSFLSGEGSTFRREFTLDQNRMGPTLESLESVGRVINDIGDGLVTIVGLFKPYF